MTTWTAIVPVNWGRDCKTRLAERLTREERDRLVEDLARHVVGQLRLCRGVAEILLLSPLQPAILRTKWRKDMGHGLNAELRAAMPDTPTLIIHADLPLLASGDVETLLAEAGNSGGAIAPDRFGTGTNALALADSSGVMPAFGEGSFSRHRALFPDAAIVRRAGLATDIDTPDDLDFVRHRLPDMTGPRHAPI